jgi:hypothetical protein
MRSKEINDKDNDKHINKVELTAAEKMKKKIDRQNRIIKLKDVMNSLVEMIDNDER